MSLASQAQDRTLIALIADEDTSTGLLLAGIGHISSASSSSSAKKNDAGASTANIGHGNRQGGGGANAVGGLMGDGDKAAQVTAQCAERNFFIVNSQTGVGEIEAAFQSFTQERNDIAILLITQPLAEKIRQVCDRYTQAFPAVLEIPSKDAPYDPSKDSILKRVQKILIDATLAQSLAAMKLRPEEVFSRLESVLQASAALPAGQRPQTFGSASTSKAAAYVKPMITQCAINELYKIQKDGPTEANAVDLAKSWERRFCNHREAIPGDRCMREVIGDTNKHRYVLAANSPALRSAIRNSVPGVPVIHVNDHQVLVLEPMSELTKKRCEQLEAAKMEAIAGKATLLGKREAEQEADGVSKPDDEKTEGVKPQPPRKKRAKGPNPLSVKKSKKAKGSQPTGTTVRASKDHEKRKIDA